MMFMLLEKGANEWDYAAGHAVAQNAGPIIKTLDEEPFLYGKEDYRILVY